MRAPTRLGPPSGPSVGEGLVVLLLASTLLLAACGGGGGGLVVPGGEAVFEVRSTAGLPVVGATVYLPASWQEPAQAHEPDGTGGAD